MSMVRAFLSQSPLKHHAAHTSNVRWRILIRQQQPVQHTHNRLLSNSKIRIRRRKVHDRDSCTGAGEPQPLGPTGHSAVRLGQSVSRLPGYFATLRTISLYTYLLIRVLRNSQIPMLPNYQYALLYITKMIHKLENSYKIIQHLVHYATNNSKWYNQYLYFINKLYL